MGLVLYWFPASNNEVNNSSLRQSRALSLYASQCVSMELADTHKFTSLPPDLAALLHIVQRPELDRRILAKEFQTIQECGDKVHILDLDLPKLYVHKTELDDCSVFWELR